jgi:hypothetical protein
MSFAARLLNVFAIPGEVFEVVRVSRFCVGNWLLPALLSAVVGAFTMIVVFSQPSIQKQVRELGDQQTKAVEQQVKAGKVSQADANQSRRSPGESPIPSRSRSSEAWPQCCSASSACSGGPLFSGW